MCVLTYERPVAINSARVRARSVFSFCQGREHMEASNTSAHLPHASHTPATVTTTATAGLATPDVHTHAAHLMPRIKASSTVTHGTTTVQ
mgnify:CR=1 FL=1